MVVARRQGELDRERFRHVPHDPSHVDEEVERAMLGLDPEEEQEGTGRVDREKPTP